MAEFIDHSAILGLFKIIIKYKMKIDITLMQGAIVTTDKKKN